MVLFGEPLAAAANPQEQSDRLRERNQKLVEMAQEIIEKTHKDKVREPIFNKAVQFLAEARLKLATNGSQEDAKALSDDAKHFTAAIPIPWPRPMPRLPSRG